MLDLDEGVVRAEQLDELLRGLLGLGETLAVDESGDREASATSGIDCSQLLSERRCNSQACYRQWRL